MAISGYAGQERRVSQDEQLGYIRGRVDSLQNELKEFKDRHVAHIEKEEERQEDLIKEIRSMKEQLSFYRHVVWTLKAAGITIAAVLTMKLGDIWSWLNK
jgi:hypothetical protein